ncbi:MAG TPA: hypothetical protein VN238_14355 [Solirubrobacteraceae bacterium]|nr:hypothetical protein [Solirubrobacteraceae bacterium]
MPTTRPRYQVTDTGRVGALLDRAAAAWPDIAHDRKRLLLRLAETGAEHLPQPADDLDGTLRDHAGQWVAIRDGRLLVAADDATAVVTWLQEHGERAEELYRVPASVEDLPAEHGLT